MTHNEIYQKTEDFATANGIGTSETTSGMNDYPSHLKMALTDFDTITQFEEVRDRLKSEGHDVEEIQLHRRDGWALWERGGVSVRKGMYATASQTETTLTIGCDESPNDCVFEFLIEGMEFDDAEQFERYMKMYKYLVAEVESAKKEDETVTLFLDPNNNYKVNYVVSDESTGYSEDTHNYKLGLLVVWAEHKYVVEVKDKDGRIEGYLSDGAIVDDEDDADVWDDHDEAAEAMQAFVMATPVNGNHRTYSVEEKA
jgi:hypothetical protein